MSGSPTTMTIDSAQYDPIAHLNAIFSHPSSLSSINATAAALRAHQDALSASIHDSTIALTSSPVDSIARMSSAKSELATLFSKIESVRTRAIETEQTITSMTAEIKRLDGTKRNLTLSMTALKRLQMLTTAYEQLRGLAKTRQYREAAGLLEAVIQLMAHFKSYRSIDQIATLSRGVSELQRELLEQVCEDFELAFAKQEVAQKRGVLSEACQVMDALGDNAKARLITWYCNTQLREYRQVFRGNDEAGSLDNISRRYSWFKRMLKTYDDEHRMLFPPHWRVDEVLANAFCEGTREDYKGILEKSMRRIDGQTLDVSLLLGCLQETMDFEHSLESKFGASSRTSIDTMRSVSSNISSDDKPHTFTGSISAAFEPYLSLWVDSQEKQLAAMIPRYKTQDLIPPDDEFSVQAVITSAIELFHFYKKTLAECSKLSTGDRLLELTKILAKYLEEYAQQVLLYFLQRPSTPQGPKLQDVILVLNTADFWHTNSQQLEENIKRRIDSNLAEKVDLSSQADTFMGVAPAAVLGLVRRVDMDLEATWREMRNTNWSKMESVGDQSSYVAELLRHVNSQAEEILPLIHKPQYARAWADNLVEHLAQGFLGNVVLCRPISEVGAEQMLLDKYVLTKNLPTVLAHSPSFPPGHSAHTSYQKRVQTALTRLDPLLKVLQVRPSPPEGLVQAYLIHINDKSDTNFRKVLDLKGVRKADQASLIELFGIHRDSPRFSSGPGGTELMASNPLMSALSLSNDSSSSSTAKATPFAAASALTGNLSMGISTPRFDAGAFGERLFSGVRDGVERMGSASSGVGLTGSSSTPATGTREGSVERGSEDGGRGAAINENLRNFGKFFRRDMSGFGGRFGTGKGSGDDGMK